MTEDVKGFRVGNCIYESEVRELMDRLKARGVCVIVIGGNRNKDDVEFSSAVRAADVPFLCRAMGYTAVRMMRDVVPFVSGTFDSNQ
jgi:hypothetical protein